MPFSLKSVTDHLHRSVAVDRAKISISPDMEWRRIFLAFWVLFGCVAGWSGYLYYSYVAGMLPSGGEVPSLEALSKSSFEPVFKAFDDRAAQFENAVSSPVPVSDPAYRLSPR